MPAPAHALAAEETRRELIARAIALAGTRGDAGALRAMIRAEQVLIVTYEQLLGGGALTPAAGRLATDFLGQGARPPTRRCERSSDVTVNLGRHAGSGA